MNQPKVTNSTDHIIIRHILDINSQIEVDPTNDTIEVGTVSSEPQIRVSDDVLERLRQLERIEEYCRDYETKKGVSTWGILQLVRKGKTDKQNLTNLPDLN